MSSTTDWVPDDRDAPPLDEEPPPEFGDPYAGSGAGGAALWAVAASAVAERPPAAVRATPARFETAQDALRTVFGYDAFRGQQQADHRAAWPAAATRSC